MTRVALEFQLEHDPLRAVSKLLSEETQPTNIHGIRSDTQPNLDVWIAVQSQVAQRDIIEPISIESRSLMLITIPEFESLLRWLPVATLERAHPHEDHPQARHPCVWDARVSFPQIDWGPSQPSPTAHKETAPANAGAAWPEATHLGGVLRTR